MTENLFSVDAPSDLKAGDIPLGESPHEHANPRCDIDFKTGMIRRDIKKGQPYFVCRLCIERIKWVFSHT